MVALLLAFAADVPADLALVAPDALWFLSVRASDVVADARVKAALAVLPEDDEFSVNRFEDENGVKLAALERLTVYQRRTQLEPLFVVRGKADLDRKAIVEALGISHEVKLHGRTLIATKDASTPRRGVVFADARTALIGPVEAVVPALAALAKGDKTHPLAGELTAAAGKHSFVVGMRPSLLVRTADAESRDREDKGDRPKIAVEKIEDAPLKFRTLEQIAEEPGVPDDWLPAGLLASAAAPLSARTARLTADLGDGVKLAASSAFDAEEDASDSEAFARYYVTAGRRMIPVLTRVMARETVDPKGVTELLRQGTAVLRAVEVKRDGKTVAASLAFKPDVAPLMRWVAAERPVRADADNLRRLVLGFHSYADTFEKGMPPRAVVGPDGKALLSWRVLILPFVGENDLYMQFKLDEPWDSEHNKKLLPKMPKMYSHPAGKGDEKYTTPYQVFGGPKTLYPRPTSKTKIEAIPDGTSNTFLIAEGAKAVPWTKPEDLVMDAKAFPKLGGRFERFFHVGMCDGSVRKVRIKADEKALRLWIDPNDGTPLNDKDITP